MDDEDDDIVFYYQLPFFCGVTFISVLKKKG